MENQILFTCACHSPEHQLIISDFADESEIFISIHLSKKSFWKRLIYAVKYIFGHQCKYGAFDEIIFDSSTQQKLKNYLIQKEMLNNRLINDDK